ncbi:MAG: PIN domain-containing protein [Acidimicrobiales bacterium]
MIILDTGVLLAAADADDHHHGDAVAFFDGHASERLVLATTVATETAWLIEDRLDPATEAAFVASIAAGDFSVEEMTPADWRRSAELIATYADLGLGLVDASVVALAERLGITTVATLNHRDFRVVRPAHCDAFELVP